jgi:hypothetical protein
LREERRLRVFENRVLSRIFGRKREEVKWEWRKLHYEELNKLYSSTSIIKVIKSRRMEWEEHVACLGDRRGVYMVLVGKRERNRPLARTRRRWEDNIKMHLQEVGWCGIDWIEMAQGRDRWRALVNAVTHFGSVNCGEFLDKLRTG